MREWWMSWSTDQLLIAAAGAVLLLLAMVAIWLALGPGPKRRRRLRQVERLVDHGDWQAALTLLEPIRNGPRVSDAWQNRLAGIEGKALLQGSAAHLAEQDYEVALNYGLHAARVLNRSPLEARATVQNAMLEEIRRRFSPANWTESAALLELIERTLRVQQPSREASFWQAMCHLRDGNIEAAETHLHRARTGTDRPLDDDLPEGRGAPPAPPTPILEPSIYLGALLLRQGKAKESLRYFTEANRLDPNCPLVPLHLGWAMVSAGGDVNLAVRTLQKAIGPRGLGAWQDKPQSFWSEVWPENRSYIRKLAVKYPFQCPLWGEGPTLLIRQGQLALAQGLQRLGQHQQAAELFDQVLQGGSPSLPVLRGLGLALARLGKFEEAYRPLRMAYDLENPKDRFTTGYLALCAVKGRPAAGQDPIRNLDWAVRAVTPFSAPGDVEWAKLLSAIFAEARRAGIELSLDDQLHLCEHLTSVHAADDAAAEAFERLYREYPAVFRTEYAWLYAQAIASRPGDASAHLALLEMALHDREPAHAFFRQQGWDVEAMERAYLGRLAQARPGELPAVLGPDPLQRMEELLLRSADRAEEAGDVEEALASVEAFVRLHPDHPAALDRLAALHHRAGRSDHARAVLEQWRQRCPDAALPLVRLALLGSSTGLEESLGHFREALLRSTGAVRARIARLGARRILHEWSRPAATVDAGGEEHDVASPAADSMLTQAEAFLDTAIEADPTNAEVVADLAAVRWLRRDRPGLAALADRARAVAGDDAQQRYFLTLPHLAAGDWHAVAQACRTLIEAGDLGDARNPSLRQEAAYLAGLAQVEMGDLSAAVEHFQAAAGGDSTTAQWAQAQIGALLFRQGHFDAAAAWWQRLPPARRSAWKLTEVLGGTQMLGALEALREGHPEAAADKLRLAGKLGCRDRRLGGMLLLALFRAGRQAASEAAGEAP